MKKSFRKAFGKAVVLTAVFSFVLLATLQAACKSLTDNAAVADPAVNPHTGNANGVGPWKLALKARRLDRK